ncbi:MAG: hypothetical protein D6693_03225 [Planctomycetota bacterium]|nr:MAG: hypothetical protein D6693_03225 [Planctomycetota bacterium]
MCLCGKSSVSSAAAGFVVIAGAVVASHNQDKPADSFAPSRMVAVDRLADVSGEWEGTVSGEAFPEDVPLLVTLMMGDDGEVTGTFEIPDGEAPFQGQFDEESGVLTGAVTPDDGSNWEVELTLDGDELSGDATETNSGIEAHIDLERADD